MPYTPEQIKERYNRLPADIKAAMDSVDTTNTIVNIGQKHDLMYDQLSELVDEVGMVMVGLTPSVMFTNNIARRMQVNIGKAMLVTQDLNKEVFDKLRVSLKKIEEGHGENTEGYSDESGSVADGKEKGQGDQTDEETILTDAEKAQKASVISAVEQAGGFVIDKQEDAPLQAEKMVSDAMKENIKAKKNPINLLEKENYVTPTTTRIKNTTPDTINKPLDSRFRGNDKASNNDRIKGGNKNIESLLQPDHLLGDTPETAKTPLQATSIKQAPTQNNAPTAQKKMDQASIVDTLLSHGVAMSMDSTPAKSTKPVQKVKPYDGTDPYREPAE